MPGCPLCLGAVLGAAVGPDGPWGKLGWMGRQEVGVEEPVITVRKR